MDTQNEFITLAHLHTHELYSCLLQNPFKWADIESCVPPDLVLHEHWGKFASSVSRLLKSFRSEARNSFQSTTADSASVNKNNISESDTDGGEEVEGLKTWAQMMTTCFQRSPELYWEDQTSQAKLMKESSEMSSFDLSKLKLNGKELIQNRSTIDINQSLFVEYADSLSTLKPLPSQSLGRPSKLSLHESLPFSISQSQWQKQWQWVSDANSGAARGCSYDGHVNGTSRSGQYYFQPLACLAR